MLPREFRQQPPKPAQALNKLTEDREKQQSKHMF